MGELVSVDARQVFQLAGDLSLVGAKAVPATRSVMQGVGDAFADAWRSNATETAGQHGKHYPASISAELAFTVGSVSVDVGPDASMPQGGMGRGFEFGSRNQPAHLDGLRALDGMQVRAERALDAAIGHLFG